MAGKSAQVAHRFSTQYGAFRDGPALEVAQELVGIAARGLERSAVRNRAGEDERLFLEPLYEILDRGRSPGQQLLERWEGSWQRRVDRLIEYAAY